MPVAPESGLRKPRTSSAIAPHTRLRFAEPSRHMTSVYSTAGTAYVQLPNSLRRRVARLGDARWRGSSCRGEQVAQAGKKQVGHEEIGPTVVPATMVSLGGPYHLRMPPARRGRSVLGGLIDRNRPPADLAEVHSLIAVAASLLSAISTKAKPRGRPVSRSVTIFTADTVRTEQGLLQVVFVALCAKLPT